MMNRATFLLCGGLLCGATLLGLTSGCPNPPPPSPPPVTTTTTTVPSPDDPCVDLVAPLPGPLGDYAPAVWRAPEHLEDLIDLRDTVGGCDPDDPYGKLENTSLRLRRDYGLCSVWKEETLLIQRSDDPYLFEEYYAVNLRTGCFATRDRMYKGVLAWIPGLK